MSIISSQDTTLRIGNWVARGGEGDEGFFIDKEGFTGWGSVGFTTEQIDIPRGAGKFPLQGFPDDRTVNIVGEVHAKSAGQMAFYESQFNALLMDGLGGKFTAEYLGESMWGYAFRSGSPGQFRQVQYGRLARFQLQLWFPNPRKYGEVLKFPTGVPAYHRGNYFAAPVMTVTGNTLPGGYALIVPGTSLRYEAFGIPLTGGHTHVIDMATGQLFIDGVPYTGGSIGQADTWLIPPFDELATALEFAAGGNATVSTSVTETSI